MLVENNWITSNVVEKSNNNRLDFRVTINPYTYKKVSFQQASEDVAVKIESLGRPIYIAFSGGADSEYVVRTFNRLGIPFKAITVNTTGNLYELAYAKRVYDEFPNIEKEILDLTNPKEFLKGYIDIVKTFGAAVINSVGSVEAMKYVKSKNGLLVTGDSFLGYGFDKNGIKKLDVCEWDFYGDWIDPNLVAPFFFYDLPMTNSFTSLFDNSDNEQFKSSLFSTIWRPKFKTHFLDSKIYDVINTINKSTTFSRKEIIYSRDEFLSLIK